MTVSRWSHETCGAKGEKLAFAKIANGMLPIFKGIYLYHKIDYVSPLHVGVNPAQVRVISELSLSLQ